MASDRSTSFEVESMIRGYHWYNAIWEATIGEVLPCKMELSNPEDRFAVAVCKHDITVGHVPRRISSICSSLLWRGGTITCRVTGARRYSPCSDTALSQENNLQSGVGRLQPHF